MSNTGIYNTGNGNSGDFNSGDRNSGYFNSGNCNSGNGNSGDFNSGDCNSGYFNSGNCNSGNCNSGDWNSGDFNCGDWNSGDWNSGYFNTNSPNKVRIFNTWVDMTHEEFNQKFNISAAIPLNRWVDKSDMTDTEKSEISGWETMGGYLKTLEFKEACRIWWNDNPGRHDDYLNLPNFDAKIFEEITGINADKPTETIEIEGQKYTLDETKKALGKK